MAETALSADSAPVQSKACTKCGEVKPHSEFAAAATGRFGLRGDCRPCRKATTAKWYSGLPAARKLARGRTPGHVAYMAAYVRKHEAEIRESRRQDWANRDVAESRRIARETMRRKRATAKGKLQNNVSRALNRALKGKKDGAPSFGLLEFTINELIAHLERQFLRGMTWKNYGKWHVDHIRPLSSFDYENASDLSFKEAWALTNLRPLWAKDNIAKSARRIFLL